MDIPEFLERVQDDKELLLELLNIYEEDYKGKREQLGAAIEAGNVQETKNLAHSLKGASGNISAKQLRLFYRDIEDTASADNMDEMKNILASADEEYAKLTQRMNEVRAEFGS